MFRRVLLLSAVAAALPASAQQLTGTPTGVETVQVTASPLAKHLDDTPSISAVLDRNDILQGGGGTLANALSTVPGVTGSGFAAGASRPIIRGMDSSRVRLVENGLSSSDVSDIGPDHGVPLDPLSTQTLEVVRGAATLRYGSQAIGGVVNAINNRVPTALPDKPAIEAMAGYASSANTGEGSVSADTATDNIALHLDAFYRKAGDYDTPLGTQANSFFTGSGFSLGGTYFFDDKNRTGAAIVQYDAKYGIPSDVTHIQMRQTKFLSRSSFDLASGPLGALNIDAGYADYTHDEKNPDGSIAATFKNKELDAHIEQMIGAIGPMTSAAVGIEVQNRAFSALGDGANYLLPTVTNTVAGYIFAETPLRDTLHLETSARLEHVAISGTPVSGVATDRRFTPISGAAGLLYDATSWLKLGFTASSAARAPAQTELFARGGHDGPGTYETGDPTLHIERANALEATARLRLADFTFDASLWSSWFDNYIYGQLTGRMCDDAGACATGGAGDLKELNYVQQSAHFRGLEGKGTYKLWDSGSGVLQAEIQGDYVRATLTGGSNVPRIPPYRLGGGIGWEGDIFDAGLQVMFNGRQGQAGAFETPTPSYTELNANIAWRFAPGYELDLSGHNLTDAVERNAASFNKDTIVLPGRDIRLTLRASL